MAPLSDLYAVLRPWTFSASLTPVLLGAVLSYRIHGSLDPLLLLLTLAAVLFVNGAGNLVNTYFDKMRGSEPRGGGGGRGGIPDRRRQGGREGELSTTAAAFGHAEQTRLVNFAAYLYGFGMGCLGLLMRLSAAKSEHLAALFFGGLSSSFLYTGGVGFKYYILGDLVVVFTFGPLAMLFSFVVQSGRFSFRPLLLALPLAFSTEAIIHSKHMREAEADQRAGVVSLAVLLGRQGSYFLFTLLLFVPYMIFVFWSTQTAWTLGLPLLTMPYAFKIERSFRERGPSRALSANTAKLNLLLSSLFVVGCLFAGDIPIIRISS